jgi:hypothetical protein
VGVVEAHPLEAGVDGGRGQPGGDRRLAGIPARDRGRVLLDHDRQRDQGDRDDAGHGGTTGDAPARAGTFECFGRRTRTAIAMPHK